jgi:hypothetical protein
MTKLELIEVFERNLKILKDPNIPDKFPLVHHIDTGGYSDDYNQIYEFDLYLSYNNEDSVLVLEYFGDENPGTPGIPGVQI